MKEKRIIVYILVLAVLSGFLVYENICIDIDEYEVSCSDLPEAFDGLRILQISDLHNRVFGKNNEKLVDAVKSADPDIIVITGDLIDSNHTDVQAALIFINNIADIAPCYYCPGNHESALEYSKKIKPALVDAGVVVLDNSKSDIVSENDKIVIAGIDDPTFSMDYYDKKNCVILMEEIHSLNLKEEDYNILLSHRPEEFEMYVKEPVDIVFSGHAHGGQVRFPVVGGLYAPNQGWFPKYDAGIYKQEGHTMVVSRGIGNSVIRVRIGNSPQLIVCTLKRS